MPRRFRQHDFRQVVDLSGIWDFTFLGDVDPDALDIAAIAFDDRMAVPGCFDATPAYAGRRGLAAYRTRVVLRDRLPHRLIFDGVQHWCRVFVDGQQLCAHDSGFSRFVADLNVHQLDDIEIIVLVDNRFDAGRSPLHQASFDWYHFGGIARSVELHRLGELWIDSIQTVTQDAQARRVGVTIHYGATTPPGRTPLTIAWDDRVVLDEEIDINNEAGRIECTLNLPGVTLWSPCEPNLHLLHVRLGEDDMRERVGIRQVRVDGRNILINELPIRLLGFNRHESHPQFGHSQPDALLVADIQQLQALGCNFVRGSHYPQDARFLDLCDEAGICVWSEAISWQASADQLNDQRFLDAQLTHIDAMVAAAINHPALIFWGVLNEGHSHDPRSRASYEVLLGRLRQLDSSRLVSYASNHPFDDLCFDLVDVLAINCYPGWYEGSIADIPERLDAIVAHLDAAGQAERPILISEIGAGAIPGWRDWNHDRWTEQYQAELLEAVIRHLFFERDRVCGLSIWAYNDFRTADGPRLLERPRGFNDKGVVDEYRRPKLAYEVVRRLFRTLG